MSKFDESKHPRDSDGKFTDGEISSLPSARKVVDRIPQKAWDSVSAAERNMALKQELHQKKMTSEEKIASVHIDFDKDNILPELNDDTLEKLGVEKNKSVLLKKSIIDRNREEHGDLTDEDFEQIITKALYSPSDIFIANKEKPYFHFAKVIEINSKGKPEIGLALLDVDNSKEHFEVVHAHFMEVPRFEKMRKNKKD